MTLTDDQIYSVLKKVLDRIGSADITWRLNGSSNLRVCGMDISVNDIDVSTNTSGAEIIKQRLAEYLLKDEYKDTISCRVLMFIIDGCEFEVAVYKDGRAMYDKIQSEQWKGLTLPVLPLRYAREFYSVVGLLEKADLIDAYIRKKRNEKN